MIQPADPRRLFPAGAHRCAVGPDAMCRVALQGQPASLRADPSGPPPSQANRAARQTGFTLLEIMVGLLILIGVMSGILACLDGGLRVYARIQAFGSDEIDVYLAGEQIERDLLAWIPAASDRLGPRELRFMRMSFTGAAPVRVRYHAPVEGGLYLQEGDASHRAGGGEMQLLDPALQVSFRFAVPFEVGAWQSDWTGTTNIPVAVELLVEGPHAATGPVSRVMLLPARKGKEEPSV